MGKFDYAHTEQRAKEQEELIRHFMRWVERQELVIVVVMVAMYGFR